MVGDRLVGLVYGFGQDEVGFRLVVSEETSPFEVESEHVGRLSRSSGARERKGSSKRSALSTLRGTLELDQEKGKEDKPYRLSSSSRATISCQLRRLHDPFGSRQIRVGRRLGKRS
jgi:hypothetical protein